LADVNPPGITGLEFCARLVADRPHLAVIVMTAFASMRSAIDAIRAGAYDYIEKPIDIDAVGLRVARIVRECRIRDEARRLREAVTPAAGFGGLSGTSAPMPARSPFHRAKPGGTFPLPFADALCVLLGDRRGPPSTGQSPAEPSPSHSLTLFASFWGTGPVPLPPGKARRNLPPPIR